MNCDTELWLLPIVCESINSELPVRPASARRLRSCLPALLPAHAAACHIPMLPHCRIAALLLQLPPKARLRGPATFRPQLLLPGL